MLGLDEREQDLIHTAGLLHDIGKFIFPDSILFADRKLTDDEWETMKLHPEQGAKLVGASRATARSPTSSYTTTSAIDGNGYPTASPASRSRSARASSRRPTPTT